MTDKKRCKGKHGGCKEPATEEWQLCWQCYVRDCTS